MTHDPKPKLQSKLSSHNILQKLKKYPKSSINDSPRESKVKRSRSKLKRSHSLTIEEIRSLSGSVISETETRNVKLTKRKTKNDIPTLTLAAVNSPSPRSRSKLKRKESHKLNAGVKSQETHLYAKSENPLLINNSFEQKKHKNWKTLFKPSSKHRNAYETQSVINFSEADFGIDYKEHTGIDKTLSAELGNLNIIEKTEKSEAKCITHSNIVEDEPNEIIKTKVKPVFNKSNLDKDNNILIEKEETEIEPSSSNRSSVFIQNINGEATLQAAPKKEIKVKEHTQNIKSPLSETINNNNNKIKKLYNIDKKDTLLDSQLHNKSIEQMFLLNTGRSHSATPRRYKVVSNKKKNKHNKQKAHKVSESEYTFKPELEPFYEDIIKGITNNSPKTDNIITQQEKPVTSKKNNKTLDERLTEQLHFEFPTRYIKKFYPNQLKNNSDRIILYKDNSVNLIQKDKRHFPTMPQMKVVPITVDNQTGEVYNPYSSVNRTPHFMNTSPYNVYPHKNNDSAQCIPQQQSIPQQSIPEVDNCKLLI